MTERFVLRNVKRVNGEEIDIVLKITKIVQVTKAGAGEGGKVLDYSGTRVVGLICTFTLFQSLIRMAMRWMKLALSKGNDNC